MKVFIDVTKRSTWVFYLFFFFLPFSLFFRVCFSFFISPFFLFPCFFLEHGRAAGFPRKEEKEIKNDKPRGQPANQSARYHCTELSREWLVCAEDIRVFRKLVRPIAGSNRDFARCTLLGHGLMEQANIDPTLGSCMFYPVHFWQVIKVEIHIGGNALIERYILPVWASSGLPPGKTQQ